MARVRVGVKRIENGCEVREVGDEATAEIHQMWVEINGRRFDAGELGLMEVTYGSRSADDKPGVGYILLRLMSGGFETVDHRTPALGAEPAVYPSGTRPDGLYTIPDKP